MYPTHQPRLRGIFFTIFLLCGFFIVASVQGEEPAKPQTSDARALALADQVMTAMGGAENYAATRYLAWEFFGRRYHVWDKFTGNIRVEYKDESIVLMNINTKAGKAWLKGEPILEAEALAEKLERAYSAWINDSYWLVMPYKLKDPGVVLRYSREDKTEDGRGVDVLTMTFESVGLTPNNKYEVYIDKETRLVTLWRFFKSADDAEPQLITPWANWQTYGDILLSDDRGKGKLTRVAVFETLPASVFDSPDPITTD